MPAEVLSIAQKKQAIAKGLSPFIHGTVLERVLGYWEQHYGHQPSFVLNRFLNEICTTDELRLHRKDMLREVLFEMAAVEKQLRLKAVQPKKDQKVIEQKVAENQVVEKLVSASLGDAFARFVQRVMQGLPAADVADFNVAVKAQLQAIKLSVDASRPVNDPEFLEFVPLSQYAKVITALYEVYCEFYGPTKADQIYAQSKLAIKAEFPEVDLHQLL